MKELKLRGGARIGMANANFPFATLEVGREKLALNVTIIGDFVFQPSDVISIEPYVILPIIGQGVRINHNIASYKEKIIFWSFKDPQFIIQQIEQTGFLKNTSQTINKTIVEKQKAGGNPFKNIFLAIVFLVWNALFLYEFFLFKNIETDNLINGKGVLTAISLVFLTALAALISQGFRKLILKEGRDLDNIKTMMIFVLIISGIMLFLVNKTFIAPF